MSFIPNGQVKIHYKVEGAGDCLVLMHGFYGSIADWYEFGYVEALKQKFQLILIDARGHGQSDKPHEPAQYSLNLRALDVITVLDALGIAKCHYMGYSMGGWIGFGLMRWHPKRFRSFILNAVHPFETEMMPLREGVQIFETWVPQSDMSAERKQRFLSNDKDALLAAVADNRTDNSGVLKNIAVPCLMMDGEADGIFDQVKEASKFSENIKFVPIPGADHVNSLGQSELVVPRVEQFLDSL